MTQGKHRFADKEVSIPTKETTVVCTCGTKFRFSWGKSWENSLISGDPNCGLLHFKWVGGQLDG